MKFESLKCDECLRIQDQANHWLKMRVCRSQGEGDKTVLILGEVDGFGFPTPTMPVTNLSEEEHDLCGQGCAVKHIAKLLKWNVATEAQ